MFAELSLINIDELKLHEVVNSPHLRELQAQISRDGYLKVPIIVDKNSLVILDGHHRLNCCKNLGFKRIPCMLVDYFGDSEITVSSRRKNFKITKRIVIAAGLTGSLFPYKTTKHFVPYKFKNLFIPLTSLQ
jgi:hypothetical protein